MTAQILYVVLSICCLYYADFLHKNIKPAESPPANIEKKDFIPSWEYYWAAYDKNNYTLSLHDALPEIGRASCRERGYSENISKSIS